jgi:hypothetical protein
MSPIPRCWKGCGDEESRTRRALCFIGKEHPIFKGAKELDPYRGLALKVGFAQLKAADH